VNQYDVYWLAFHTCLALHFPPLHFGAAIGGAENARHGKCGTGKFGNGKSMERHVCVDGPCLLDYLVIELDLSVVLYVTLPLTLATVD